MTPAIRIAEEAHITFKIHEYQHDPACRSFGSEAARQLNMSPERVFKTLVVRLNDKDLAVAILPVATMLSLKRMAGAAGAKKAAMAEPGLVERATGYLTGGISPLGQKKKLRTIIDGSANDFPTICVSAGRRGLQMELNPADLRQLTHGTFADIGQP
jgi:Cys-tRNA(Pro)/Cys-tRNA(Cys) deacylase